MSIFESVGDDPVRNAALRRYARHEAPSEPVFDRIARLAAQVTGASRATISFLGTDRQWTPAGAEPPQTEGPWAQAPLREALRSRTVQRDGLLVVEDATADERFGGERGAGAPHAPSSNGTGDPALRFYAGAPLVTSDGEAIGVLYVMDTVPRALSEGEAGALRDLAATATSELELRAARFHRKEVLESITNAFYALDGEWRFTYINARAERLLNRSRAELLGQSVWDEFPEAAKLPLYEHYHRAVREGRTVEFELYFPPLETWFQVRAYPFEGGLSVYFNDVTEQKETEEALRRSRDLLAQTQRLAGAWELDVPAQRITWSEEVYRIHEVPPGTEIRLEDGIDFYAPEARPTIRAAVTRAIQDGEPWDVELPLITATGKRRWVRAVGAPTEIEDGAVIKVAGAFQDITKQKREVRRRSQVIRRVTDAIVEVDADWRFTLVNDQAEALYDMREEDLLGKNFWDIFAGALGTRLETTYRRVMTTREPDRVVEYYPGLSGWFDIYVYPNDDGGVAFYFTEVTERKEREQELRAAKEQAEEMSRLKSAFLANMSHEIRTPLTAIIGFAELLDDLELSGPADEFVPLIHRGGQRLLRTLNSVLDLSQLDAGAMKLYPEEVDVDTLIRDVVEGFTYRTAEANVDLTLDMPQGPVNAYLDPSALQRIVSNLVSNAIKFTGEGAQPGGQVTVRLAAAGDTIRLAVADTGVGIDPAFLPHIFDAFKQESTGDGRAFEGSGLGLTITARLVQLLGGSIDIDSTKGEGATVTVEFPRGGGPPASNA